MSDIVKVNPSQPAAMPGSSSFAGSVHQNAAHYLCANRKKMSPAFQWHVLNGNQFQVDLMHQSRWLQDWFFALAFHKIDGQAVKLLVNPRRKSIKRGGIAAGPRE